MIVVQCFGDKARLVEGSTGEILTSRLAILQIKHVDYYIPKDVFVKGYKYSLSVLLQVDRMGMVELVLGAAVPASTHPAPRG